MKNNITDCISILSGNILDSTCQTLVNPVNCVGVAGAGLALEFKNRFPAVHEEYVGLCRKGAMTPGRPRLVRGKQNIVLFPTKNHWQYPSDIQWVAGGMSILRAHRAAWGIESLAVPALGCGLGGLRWPEVKRVMVRHLFAMRTRAEIYVPRADRTGN